MNQAYTLPEIYDIAFPDRDFESEVDFLLEAAGKYLGRRVESALELGCGPGRHVLEMARRGLHSTGLDLEPAMVKYAREIGAKSGYDYLIHQGDMRHFDTGRKYDLVYIVLVSFAELLTNLDILDNLNCVADILNDGGIYIVSTAHPRDFYEPDPPEHETWTMARGDITVETDWGGCHQKYDPLTETDDIIIRYNVTTPGGTQRHEFPARYRRLSIMTFEALLRCCGRYELVAAYGDMDMNVKLSNGEESIRYIPVLRKVR